MSSQTRDSNRYAEGLEAESLRARICHDEVELAVLLDHLHEAENALREAETRLRQTESLCVQYKHLHEDAEIYAQSLRQKVDSKLNDLTQRRSFFDSVRRVPPEIMGQIFQHCNHDIDECNNLSRDDDDVRARKKQPFVLAAVCRRWRSISLGCPRAWSHIELSFDLLKSDQSAPLWNSYLDTFLSRSSIMPLTLFMHRNRARNRRDVDVMRHVASQLLPRCTSLYINVNKLYHEDPFYMVLAGEAPDLVHATVISHVENLSPLELFPTSVRLRSFDTVNLYNLAGAPISVLQDACLENADCSQISMFMRSAQALSTLRLNFPLMTEPGFYMVPQPCWSLTDLTVQTDGRSNLTLLSQFVSFPNLRAFSIVTDTGSVYGIDYLSSIVSSSLALRYLSVWRISSAFMVTFCTALRRAKQLQLLRIHHSFISREDLLTICGALMTPVGDDLLWPCRQLFAVLFSNSCVFADDCDYHCVVDMIKTRREASENNLIADPPVPLRRFQIPGFPDFVTPQE